MWFGEEFKLQSLKKAFRVKFLKDSSNSIDEERALDLGSDAHLFAECVLRRKYKKLVNIVASNSKNIDLYMVLLM
jgi:hypothetical protein